LGSTQPIQALPAAITPRARNRSVFDAFTGARWITDIKGAFTLDVLVEYLALWDLLSEVTLHSDIDDVHVWQLSTTGQYTAKSAYENLEPLVWALGREFGKVGRLPPGKCKFFLWTAALNRCWTADRLARKGLPHPAACPLCDQVAETIDHLLVECVFSRQVWFSVLQHFSLQVLVPQTNSSFFDWWEAAISRVDSQVQKGLNTIIILVAWSIWKHRNRCIFDGVVPDVSCVVSVCKEELRQWSLAGAREVSYLLAQEHPVG